MAKKTFKIGEYAKGGIIAVEINNKEAIIIGKDWDYSAGTKKGSDQSNAKEFTREVIDLNGNNPHRVASTFLNDLTTHYYAEQIMDWMEANSDNFKKRMFW
jgi:hypothetical protein